MLDNKVFPSPLPGREGVEVGPTFDRCINLPPTVPRDGTREFNNHNYPFPELQLCWLCTQQHMC